MNSEFRYDLSGKFIIRNSSFIDDELLAGLVADAARFLAYRPRGNPPVIYFKKTVSQYMSGLAKPCDVAKNLLLANPTYTAPIVIIRIPNQRSYISLIRFYGIIVHELKHLKDFSEGKRFRYYRRGRTKRMAHDLRPHEIRANDAEHNATRQENLPERVIDYLRREGDFIRNEKFIRYKQKLIALRIASKIMRNET